MSTIVHIEDDDAVANIVRTVLGREGYTVLRAITAYEGIELVNQHHPDLVIIDMWLPEGIDGWEATQMIKDSPQFAHIPIVALTAQSGVEAEQRAYDAGCDGYIPKPFEVHQLRNAINDILGYQ